MMGIGTHYRAIMTAKQFLAAGKEAGLCAYYTMWLYYHGHSLSYQAANNADYIIWINGKHNEFRPFAKHPNSGKYYDEFVAWLVENAPPEEQ